MNTVKPLTLLERLRRMRGRKRTLTAIGTVLVLATLYAFRPDDPSAAKNQFYEVKRGNFSVTITEGGSLRAVNEVIIRSEVEGTPRIIKIVPEGTVVTNGQVLVELDSADLRDRKTQQELQVEQAQFSYDASVQDLAIQKSVHESNMKDAELKVLFAKSDLEKYVEGDVLQLLKTATNTIFLAQEDLKQGEERHKWSETLFEKDFLTRTELEKDKLAVERAKITLEKAETEMDLLKRYDIPKRKLQLEANMDAAVKEMERIRIRGEAAIAQQEQTVSSRKRALDLQMQKLTDLTQQIALTRIVAPQDGMVVYPFSESSRYSSSSSQIEEGAQVRQRQELIKLPDTSQMLVEIKVHESYVNQIRPGLPANVMIDSLPDSSFDGIIRKVGVLPDTTSRYSNPNLKVYNTEVLITDKLPEIKPGVSARAEIIITNLLAVITVPIQAVTTVKGKQVCYVTAGFGDPMPVNVEVGLYNDKFIEIKSGLREGDRVLLSPPLSIEEVDPESETAKNMNRKARELQPGELPGEKKVPAADGAGAPGDGKSPRERPPGSEGEKKFKRPPGEGSSGERPSRPSKATGT
jgi:HlyD family secretion protein